MIETFIPIIKKAFELLNQPPVGTDDVVQLTAVRRSYLNFIHSLLNSNLEEIFVDPSRCFALYALIGNIINLNSSHTRLVLEIQSHLDSIFQSIIHYATDESDIQSQRLSIAVIQKMVTSWGNPNKDNEPLKAENQDVAGGNAGNAGGADGSSGAAAKSPSGVASRPVRRKSVLPGFDQFIYSSIVPMCFQVPLRKKAGPDSAGDGQNVLVRVVVVGGNVSLTKIY